MGETDIWYLFGDKNCHWTLKGHLCPTNHKALITLCVFKVALGHNTQDSLHWVHLKVL